MGFLSKPRANYGFEENIFKEFVQLCLGAYVCKTQLFEEPGAPSSISQCLPAISAIRKAQKFLWIEPGATNDGDMSQIEPGRRNYVGVNLNYIKSYLQNGPMQGKKDGRRSSLLNEQFSAYQNELGNNLVEIERAYAQNKYNECVDAGGNQFTIEVTLLESFYLATKHFKYPMSRFSGNSQMAPSFTQSFDDSDWITLTTYFKEDVLDQSKYASFRIRKRDQKQGNGSSYKFETPDKSNLKSRS